MAEPLILLNNVTRHFVAGTQRIPVLKSISLTIMPGEMVAIMGASGSGKSTLMNIIGCLDKPSSGEVYINGIAAHQADSAELAELAQPLAGIYFSALSPDALFDGGREYCHPCALYRDARS